MSVLRYVSNNLGGGARIHVYQLNRALESAGIETKTFIPYYKSKDLYTDQDCVEFEYSNFFGFFDIFLYLLKNRKKIDLLHSHLKQADVFLFVLSLLFKIDHVITIHYPYKSKDSKYLVLAFHRYAIKHAKKVIFISEYVKSEILKNYSIKSLDNDLVIYNASDSTHSKRASFEKMKICLVGELTRRKGFEDFTKLIEGLHNAGLSYELNIYGEGEFESVVRAYEADAKYNVKYHGYVMDHDEIYSNNNIILSLSHGEAFGRTVTEGMAAGLVPVLRNDGAFPELVCNLDSGFLFSDIDSLIEFLSVKSNDLSFFEFLSVQAKLRYKNKFSLVRFDEQVIALFSEVLL